MEPVGFFTDICTEGNRPWRMLFHLLSSLRRMGYLLNSCYRLYRSAPSAGVVRLVSCRRRTFKEPLGSSQSMRHVSGCKWLNIPLTCSTYDRGDRNELFHILEVLPCFLKLARHLVIGSKTRNNSVLVRGWFKCIRYARFSTGYLPSNSLA